ncbi:uncharacterized protein LOC116252894 [Nymphaea colorata]|nr:uncharacterized protein LOC116252894 [Nymphaea colorata]
MVATRVLRSCRTVQMDLSPASASPSSAHSMLRFPVRASGLDGRNSGKCATGGDSKRTMVRAVVSDAVVVHRRAAEKGAVDLRELLSDVVAAVEALKLGFGGKSWKLKVQKAIEKFILDFRFGTLIAVVGSLLGSILCFAEGCNIIARTSMEYFHAMWQRTDQAQTVLKLMEAIDMFLVGTAMLVFGMALYNYFIRPRHLKQSEDLQPNSNLLGLFHLKSQPQWVEMGSLTEIKTKIGHAVVMILHVGILEKFQNVTIANAMDLTCFAGAILVSSACVFLLSRLAVQGDKSGR